MEQNLLIAAKNYQKQHQWEKAIACYEEYINKNGNNSADTVFASYAKCLRIIGKTSVAKDILMSGNTLYPYSKHILVGLFTLYDVLGDWDAAKSVATALIEINPEQADYYFKLGRAYTGLVEFKQAEQAYENGLSYTHGMPFEQLAEKIQSGFIDHPEAVTAEYKFIKGKNNFGAIIHQNKDQKYFTKITRNNQNAKREETFYKELCAHFPVLKQISPAYIDSQVIDRILYLTVEMIDGMQGGPIDNIIDVSKQITAVSYQDFIQHEQNPNYLFQLKSRAVSIFPFFTQIHKQYYNQKLFAALYLLAQQKTDPKTAKKIVHRLETMIMDNRLYTFIDPEEDYTLLHGDFIPQNIKGNARNETLNVFDWATFTTGPRFLDIARYMSASAIPYEDVKEKYVFNNKVGNLSQIEQIFFLYAFILMHFVPSSDKPMNEKITEWIAPALEDMEACVTQLKHDYFGTMVQSLLDERKKAKSKTKKQNRRIAQIKRERKTLQTTLNNVLTSKSWRMTAPLRKLTEWIKATKRSHKEE